MSHTKKEKVSNVVEVTNLTNAEILALTSTKPGVRYRASDEPSKVYEGNSTGSGVNAGSGGSVSSRIVQEVTTTGTAINEDDTGRPLHVVVSNGTIATVTKDHVAIPAIGETKGIVISNKKSSKITVSFDATDFPTVNESEGTANQNVVINKGVTVTIYFTGLTSTTAEVYSQIADDIATQAELDTALNTKVDKVTGKGLSTNDYTTTEKNKLNGIAAGAEVNVQGNWTETETTSDAFIKNKPTIPTVNDGISDGNTESAPSENAVFDALALKQDTLESGTNIKTVNGQTILGSGDVPATVTVTNTTLPTLTGSSTRTTTVALTTAEWGNQIPVDASAGDVHVTLPSAVGQTGAIRFLRLDSSVNKVWVHGFQQEGIGRVHNGVTSIQIGSLGELTVGIEANAPVVLNWSNPKEVSRLWTPNDLAARAIDLDFRGLTAVDGTAIASIANAGSLGGFYTSNVAGQAPLLQTDSSGKRLARFDGTNDWMRSSTLADGVTPMVHPLGNQFGLFAVLKLNENIDALECIIVNELTNSQISYGMGGMNQGHMGGFYDGAWHVSSLDWNGLAGEDAVTLVNYDQVNVIGRLDGASFGSTAKTIAPPTAAGATRIGRRWDFPLEAGNVLAMDAYRIVGKAGAWTAAEMNFLEGYGMWLTGRSLPGGHAYATTPPLVSIATL